MIDEKKLIESLRSSLNTGRETFPLDMIIDCIEEKPKVGEWIPCSERLPEVHRVEMETEGEYYMISDSVIITDGKRMCITEYEVDDKYRKGWLNHCDEEMEEIIAWQPLPEPYRPEKESE